MSSTNMNVFASYNFENLSNINKFVENTLEELKYDTQDILRDHLRQNDGIDIDSYDQTQQCFDISKIKKEPSFNFDDQLSSTRMSFSPSSENNYEEKQYDSNAKSLNKDMEDEENHPPIWKYEMESTLDNKKSTLVDIQTSTKIQGGNTHRLLNLFETSCSDFKESRNNKNNNQENTISKEITLNNPKEDKQKKLSNKTKINDDAFQMGRQKGIREILSSMVSPISASNMSSVGSPDLSLSYLQKENVMLLNKLSGNSGSLTRPNFEDTSKTRPNFEDTSKTRPNFEDTSNIYAANVSKEESRININSDCKESKIRRANDKLELETYIKIWLKPFWNTDIINKDEYKNIMMKCVRKISCWKEEERTQVTIRRLVEFYIKKIRHNRESLKSVNSLRNTFSSEKRGSKSKTVSNLSETDIVLNDVSNKKCNSLNNDCSGKSSNIEITIKQSCCNTRKQSCCKKSGKINSQKIVVSGQKRNVKIWRY